MTETKTTKTDQGEIKRYLFGELPQTDREMFEERLFLDEDFFFAVAAAEDDLVDRYVAGSMPRIESDLFERRLETVPTRREKVRNARVISEFIRDEKALYAPRQTAETSPASGLRASFREWFAFRTSTFAYAFAGMSAILVVSTFALFWSNSRLRDENARLYSSGGDAAEWRTREQKLSEDLNEAKKREADLATRIDSESEVKEDLTSDLVNERETRRQLEIEIAKLHKLPPNSSETKTSKQSVQTLSLDNSSPQSQELSTTVQLGDAVKQMAIIVKLPDSVSQNDQMTVAINGRQIPGKISARTDAKGGKRITVSIAVGDLKAGANKITVLNKAGVEVTTYSFSTEK